MKFSLSDSIITVDTICVIVDTIIQGSPTLQLSRTLGEDMRYQISEMSYINYPGEYEIDGLTIECIGDSEGKLNYVINQNDTHIGYIQNPKLATNRIFADVTDWICDRDDVISAIEKLDESGKIHALHHIIS